MRPTAVFISVGRGKCVDEDALASALREDRIAGAALDVFQEEPLPQSSPLWPFAGHGTASDGGREALKKEPRVLITAHNADYTEDYFDKGWHAFVRNLELFAQGGRSLATPVDKSVMY
jgi:phosphoglycerate dehydrogenase-like enzyme